MNRKELVRHLSASNCVILREGKSHTVVMNILNKRQSSVPRHNEISRFTAKAICRQLGISDPMGI